MRVEYYELPDGTMPAEDFILSQPVRMRAKILRNLELLERFGTGLREPYSRYMGDGLYEIRTRIGSDITRVLYFFYKDDCAILTNGFVKKSQKTPRRHLERARVYRSDYLQRAGAQHGAEHT